jgi:hypothetical protein
LEASEGEHWKLRKVITPWRLFQKRKISKTCLISKAGFLQLVLSSVISIRRISISSIAMSVIVRIHAFGKFVEIQNTILLVVLVLEDLRGQKHSLANWSKDRDGDDKD